MISDRSPLGRFCVTSTDDLDEARTAVGRSLCPHRLDLAGTAFRLRHNIVTVGRVGMHYIDYGGDVRVETDGLPFLLVQIPLAGSMQVSSASGDDVVVAPGAAVVTGVAAPVRMTYRNHNPRLMLRVAPGDLLARSRRICDSVPDIRSTSVIDLTNGSGRTLRNLVDLIVTDYDSDDDRHRSDLADSLGTAVIDALACARSESEGDVGMAPTAGPRALRRAVEVINERCGDPLTVADVAEATNTGVRSLQALFRSHLGTTVAAHIRLTRLERVRRDLRSGAVPNVTEAALRWSVPHLGRFSRDYRTMFGELPSETLRAARGV